MSNVFKFAVFETQVYETYASLAWADKPRINMSYHELISILPLIWSTKQMEFSSTLPARVRFRSSFGKNIIYEFDC